MGLFLSIYDCEIPLGINKDGIYTTIMDANHISMLTFKAKSTIFEFFHTSKDIKIGIDQEEIKKFLKKGYEEEVTADLSKISYNGEEISILLTKKDQKLERTFFLKSYYTTYGPNNYKLPDLNYSYKITLKAEIFKTVLQDCYKIQDNFSLFFREESENKFWAEAHYEKSYSYVAIIEDTIKIEGQGNAEGNYNLSMLVDILPFLRDEITIYLGHEIPLIIDFKLWGADCSYCLAPRAEKGEEEGEICNK